MGPFSIVVSMNYVSYNYFHMNSWYIFGNIIIVSLSFIRY